MMVAVIQLHDFPTPIVGKGRTWRVYALGARRDDERWIGWLEFVAVDGEVRVTGRETTQASFGALVYWATGLEPVYLEGALARAIRSAAPGMPLMGERLVA